MYKHHQETILKVTNRFKQHENVLAVILGGSIAHGFEKESSDIDIMILITEDEYQKRLQTGDIHYYDKEDAAYDSGYIDGKYITMDFLEKVAEKGSDPARFAFKDGMILFSRIDGLDEILRKISNYPTDQKKTRIRRFHAQLEAWKWYAYEAIKHQNDYLLNHAITNMLLFGGRMILTYNEKLYPYHKWFYKVLEQTVHKPVELHNKADELLRDKTAEAIEAYYQCIMNFTDWGVTGLRWPAQFMMDSELNWMDGYVPVADI